LQNIEKKPKGAERDTAIIPVLARMIWQVKPMPTNAKGAVFFKDLNRYIYEDPP
jgi:hypothetical protein